MVMLRVIRGAISGGWRVVTETLGMLQVSVIQKATERGQEGARGGKQH